MAKRVKDQLISFKEFRRFQEALRRANEALRKRYVRDGAFTALVDPRQAARHLPPKARRKR